MRTSPVKIAQLPFVLVTRNTGNTLTRFLEESVRTTVVVWRVVGAEFVSVSAHPAFSLALTSANSCLLSPVLALGF